MHTWGRSAHQLSRYCNAIGKSCIVVSKQINLYSFLSVGPTYRAMGKVL